MTAKEKSLKLALIDHLKEFFNTQHTQDYWDVGLVPENLEESMADAAFAVIIAVKSTNKYRDDND